jgi:hypothetical protein
MKKSIISGVKMSSLTLVPIFVALLIIDTLRLQNVIHFSEAHGIVYDFLPHMLILVGFASPIIYWINKRQWLSAVSSGFWGIFLIVIMVYVGVMWSCFQGVCF